MKKSSIVAIVSVVLLMASAIAVAVGGPAFAPLLVLFTLTSLVSGAVVAVSAIVDHVKSRGKEVKSPEQKVKSPEQVMGQQHQLSPSAPSLPETPSPSYGAELNAGDVDNPEQTADDNESKKIDTNNNLTVENNPLSLLEQLDAADVQQSLVEENETQSASKTQQHNDIIDSSHQLNVGNDMAINPPPESQRQEGSNLSIH